MQQNKLYIYFFFILIWTSYYRIFFFLFTLLRVVTIVPRIMEDAGFFHHLSRWTGFTWLLNETLISASLLIDVSCPRSFLILLSLSLFFLISIVSSFRLMILQRVFCFQWSNESCTFELCMLHAISGGQLSLVREERNSIPDTIIVSFNEVCARQITRFQEIFPEKRKYLIKGWLIIPGRKLESSPVNDRMNSREAFIVGILTFILRRSVY